MQTPEAPGAVRFRRAELDGGQHIYPTPRDLPDLVA